MTILLFVTPNELEMEKPCLEARLQAIDQVPVQIYQKSTSFEGQWKVANENLACYLTQKNMCQVLYIYANEGLTISQVNLFADWVI